MGMGGIERGSSHLSFSAFVKDGEKSSNDSLQEIAQKYLNVTVEPSVLHIEKFQPQKATLIDWLYDFVMHFIHGHSEKAIKENESEVISILSRAPVDSTAADYSKLNALRDFVPSQYKKRFSLWNQSYITANLAIQRLRLDESSLKEKLAKPLPEPATLSSLQERLGHAALAKRYPELQALALNKEDEAVAILQDLYHENKTALDDYPVLREVLERSPRGDEARAQGHLAEAQRMLANYNSDNDIAIIQELNAIPKESSYFHAATFALLDFVLKCQDIKNYIEVFKRHNIDPDIRTEGIVPRSNEESVLLGKWLLKKEEWALAADYLEHAALAGNIEAKFELGKLYIGVSNIKHHTVAAHLLEEVLASDQKKLLRALNPELQKRVGNALFNEGRFQEASPWFYAAARAGDSESQWKYSFINLIGPEPVLLDESLVERLRAIESPETAAVIACQALRIFEKSHDINDFMTAAALLPSVNHEMMKPLLSLIKEGSDRLLTTLSKEESPSLEETTALHKGLTFLDKVGEKTPSPKKCLEISQIFTRSAEAQRPSAEKNNLLISAASWLIKARESAPTDKLDEMHRLLERLDLAPDIAAELASIKLARTAKPTESLSARLTGISDEASSHVFNAAMDFLRSLQPSTSLEPLAHLNPAVLNSFSERQLQELLQVLLAKTSPEIPEETSATDTLRKGLATAEKELTEEALKHSLSTAQKAFGEGLTSAKEALDKGLTTAKGIFTGQALGRGLAAAREALSKESLGKGLASTKKMFGEGLAAAKGMLHRDTPAGGAGREKAVETFDNTKCGNLAAAIEKALLTKKSLTGSLILAHYLEDRGQKAAAGKKADRVIASSTNAEEKSDAAALRTRVEKK